MSLGELTGILSDIQDDNPDNDYSLDTWVPLTRVMIIHSASGEKIKNSSNREFYFDSTYECMRVRRVTENDDVDPTYDHYSYYMLNHIMSFTMKG